MFCWSCDLQLRSSATPSRLKKSAVVVAVKAHGCYDAWIRSCSFCCQLLEV